MEDYILEHHKQMTYEDMAYGLGVSGSLIFQKCYAMHRMGLIDRHIIKSRVFQDVISEIEDRILSAPISTPIPIMAKRLGISVVEINTHSERLQKYRLYMPTTESKSNERKREKTNKRTYTSVAQELRRIKEMDIFFDKQAESAINQANKIHRETAKSVGDVLHIDELWGKNIVATVIKVYDRFYLCDTDRGHKTCVRRSLYTK